MEVMLRCRLAYYGVVLAPLVAMQPGEAFQAFPTTPFRPRLHVGLRRCLAIRTPLFGVDWRRFILGAAAGLLLGADAGIV